MMSAQVNGRTIKPLKHDCVWESPPGSILADSSGTGNEDGGPDISTQPPEDFCTNERLCITSLFDPITLTSVHASRCLDDNTCLLLLVTVNSENCGSFE